MSLAKRLLLAGAIALACSQPVLAETVGQTLEQADRYWVEGKLVQAQQAFEAAVSQYPEVVDCWLMTGSRDYLLRVVVRGLEDYERFLTTRLTRIEGVAAIESAIPIRRVKQQGARIG